MKCCVCLFTKEGEAGDAVTVINGQAVCYDDMAYVQGGDFTIALITWKREHKDRPQEEQAS